MSRCQKNAVAMLEKAQCKKQKAEDTHVHIAAIATKRARLGRIFYGGILDVDGLSIVDQLLDEVLYPSKPGFYMMAASGSHSDGHRAVGLVLADAYSPTSFTILADRIRGHGEDAANLPVPALPAALSAFADLSPLPLGPIFTEARIGHCTLATTVSTWRRPSDINKFYEEEVIVQGGGNVSADSAEALMMTADGLSASAELDG